MICRFKGFITIALLNAVKQKQRSERVRIQNILAETALDIAQEELKTDQERIVFWSNIYNAYFQINAVKSGLDLKNARKDFFRGKHITVLSIALSLDDIEHLILRRSKVKLGFGFVPRLITTPWEKALRVNRLDYRIHFVLNCGAVSCPVIYPLNIENFEEDLNVATYDYLWQEVKVNAPNKRIVLNQLFLFYLADFGRSKGLKRILIRYGLLKEDQIRYKWQFIPFDKTIKLDNFVGSGEEEEPLIIDK